MAGGAGTCHAYGVYVFHLANTGSAVTGSTLNHCWLHAGGATAKSSTVGAALVSSKLGQSCFPL